MTKYSLYLETFQDYIQSYKLIAPNLFDYLRLVEFVNSNSTKFYSIEPDKQTLTIYVYIFSITETKICELMPANIIMKKD